MVVWRRHAGAESSGDAERRQEVEEVHAGHAARGRRRGEKQEAATPQSAAQAHLSVRAEASSRILAVLSAGRPGPQGTHRTHSLLYPRKRGIMFLPALVCLSVCLFVCLLPR